jgi:hypothetical protein
MTDDFDDVEDAPPPLQPITIVGHNATEDGPNVRIVWNLSGRPEAWWIRAFGKAPRPSKGSWDMVGMGVPRPKVDAAGVISWTVPNPDLEQAAQIVRDAVAFANTELEAENQRREADVKQRLQAGIERAERQAEIQRRLDEA